MSRPLRPKDVPARSSPARVPMLRTNDISGWLFNGERFHVPCVLVGTHEMENPKAADMMRGTVCSMIRQYGRFKGLKNDDPRWQDSETIPQPLFPAELLDPDNGKPLYDCHICDEEIDPAWPYAR